MAGVESRRGEESESARFDRDYPIVRTGRAPFEDIETHVTLLERASTKDTSGTSERFWLGLQESEKADATPK